MSIATTAAANEEPARRQRRRRRRIPRTYTASTVRIVRRASPPLPPPKALAVTAVTAAAAAAVAGVVLCRTPAVGCSSCCAFLLLSPPSFFLPAGRRRSSSSYDYCAVAGSSPFRRRRRSDQLFTNLGAASGEDDSGDGTTSGAVTGAAAGGDSTGASTEATSPAEDAARLYRARAARARLEAERMDLALTLQKIAALEAELGGGSHRRRRRRRYRDDKDENERREELERQLRALRIRLEVPEETGVTATRSRTSESEDGGGRLERRRQQPQGAPKAVATKITVNDRSSASSSKPLCGFLQDDLDLFLPVAEDIEKRMNGTDFTVEDRLAAFKTAPELHEHFQNKIRELLVQPLNDLRKLSDLKESYLETRSRVEKDQIRREIRQLEKSMQKEFDVDDGEGSSSEWGSGGSVQDSSTFNKRIRPMPDVELQDRLRAVGELPSVLRVVYKRRCGVVEDNEENEEEDLRLAILLDHYRKQLESLEQVRFLAPLDEEQRNEVREAIESLPESVKKHFAKDYGLSGDDDDDGVSGTTALDTDALIAELEAGSDDPAWNSLKVVMDVATSSSELPSEYDDIEFLDRSRYMDEFHPSVAQLEECYPNETMVDVFVSQILDRKSFVLSNKPERVVGGYYLRGENLISDDESGTKLVERLSCRMESSPVKDEIEFFYIPDPSPLSDEEGTRRFLAIHDIPELRECPNFA